jgi:hypothetical protein
MQQGLPNLRKEELKASLLTLTELFTVNPHSEMLVLYLG